MSTTANTSNAALQQIADAIGLRHVHNHMLRHSFASAAVMRGIPIRQVQEWLGHGSIVVTMRYAHLARGLGDEMIRRLAPQPPADLQHTDHPQDSDPSEFPPLHPSNNPILH